MPGLGPQCCTLSTSRAQPRAETKATRHRDPRGERHGMAQKKKTSSIFFSWSFVAQIIGAYRQRALVKPVVRSARGSILIALGQSDLGLPVCQ
jgi:hypothetical protein